MKETVKEIVIRHLMGEMDMLYISFAADGLIQRRGTGMLSSTGRKVVKAKDKGQTFRRMQAKIEEDWSQNLGEYNYKPIKGREFKLIIQMFHTDGSESPIEITYGEKSQNPPEDVWDFCNAAIDLTAGWYGKAIKKAVQEIEVKQMTGSKELVYVSASADGTVKRRGTGMLNTPYRKILETKDNGSVFRRLYAKIDAEWFDVLDLYTITPIRGREYTLTIRMVHSDGAESLMTFVYGEDSQGPSQDAWDLASTALQSTEAWYEQAVVAVKRKSREGKKWWQF